MKERGFAAAGTTDERNQASRREAGQQLGHQPLPTGEPRRVGHPVRHQTLPRTRTGLDTQLTLDDLAVSRHALAQISPRRIQIAADQPGPPRGAADHCRRSLTRDGQRLVVNTAWQTTRGSQHLGEHVVGRRVIDIGSQDRPHLVGVERADIDRLQSGRDRGARGSEYHSEPRTLDRTGRQG